MEQREFYEQVESLADQLLPRTSPEFVPGLKSILAAVEYRMVVEQLVQGVIEGEIDISSEQRATLRRLVDHLPRNAELVAALESRSTDEPASE